jgi:hypothetical protein
MVKCGVLFEVRTEFLTITYTCFGFKGNLVQTPMPVVGRLKDNPTHAAQSPFHVINALSCTQMHWALHGGELPASRAGQFIHGKWVPVSTGQHALWALELIFTWDQKEATIGIQTQFVQPVAISCTISATSVHFASGNINEQKKVLSQCACFCYRETVTQKPQNATALFFISE